MTIRFLVRMSPCIAVLLVCACASSSGPRPNIPDSATMAVISRGVDEDLAARFNRDSTRTGAVAGAGAGAEIGWLASFSCGPLFLLCAVGAVTGGALVGAAVGATAGAVKDADKKPPEEHLLQLEALLEEIAAERTLHEEIRDATAARVPVGRRASGKQADALVELQLDDLRFLNDGQSLFYWSMSVNVAAQWNRQHGKRRGGSDHYSVTTSAEPLDHWIDQDGTAINAALDTLIQEVAQSIERDHF